MTTIQPADGAVNITVDSTNLTTDGQRNLQRRIDAFVSEVNRLKTVITENSEAYMTLLRDFEIEKEARTNAQIERDAMALKLAAFTELLFRASHAYDNKRPIAMANVMRDARAALSAYEADSLKSSVYQTLLQRVLDADAGCTGDVYAQLIDEIRIAIAAEVQS
jgi:hypothetical protein